ncbi:MAG: helix-turn-helix transcriptional regulator [Halothiobacillaceae bacterium]|nr:MAG: helix-turn-helix transcriptional regulator [Halothiobacillaceae bacterium]
MRSDGSAGLGPHGACSRSDGRISDVSRDTKINRGTLTRLYDETFERVEKDVMDKLCQYFDCSLEELFEYVKED